ncbi:MAG TPA: mechanosensitive ion channel family protein [Phenylobacterium sp.]|nr:mechanosensitive ion channel family protein [Phenylobacterium sp.]
MAFPISTDASLPPFVEQARRLLFGDGELLRHAADAAGGLAVNLALAGLILAGTIWASNWLSRLTARAIARAHRRAPEDTTLQTFAASLVRYFVFVVGLVGVLQQLGVKATSVIAVLGAASLAIGLALQGALANVAAGVMLLILRPYRVGDGVEIHGKQGTVKGLDLFSTRLSNAENLSVFVPNAKAFGEIIVNQSAPASRRAQLDFTIDYEDDLDQALELLLACAAAEPRVAAKPAPWAKLTALTERGVTVSLRVWTSPKDLEDTQYDLLKTVKERLEADGFSLPYPHQVSVEARPFQPPRSRARARPAAPKRLPAPAAAKASGLEASRGSASPRPTRAGSSQGR